LPPVSRLGDALDDVRSWARTCASSLETGTLADSPGDVINLHAAIACARLRLADIGDILDAASGAAPWLSLAPLDGWPEVAPDVEAIEPPAAGAEPTPYARAVSAIVVAASHLTPERAEHLAAALAAGDELSAAPPVAGPRSEALRVLLDALARMPAGQLGALADRVRLGCPLVADPAPPRALPPAPAEVPAWLSGGEPGMVGYWPETRSDLAAVLDADPGFDDVHVVHLRVLVRLPGIVADLEAGRDASAELDALATDVAEVRRRLTWLYEQSPASRLPGLLAELHAIAERAAGLRGPSGPVTASPPAPSARAVPAWLAGGTPGGGLDHWPDLREAIAEARATVPPQVPDLRHVLALRCRALAELDALADALEADSCTPFERPRSLDELDMLAGSVADLADALSEPGRLFGALAEHARRAAGGAS
jgi:hypothetical protein